MFHTSIVAEERCLSLWGFRSRGGFFHIIKLLVLCRSDQLLAKEGGMSGPFLSNTSQRIIEPTLCPRCKISFAHSCNPHLPAPIIITNNEENSCVGSLCLNGSSLILLHRLFVLLLPQVTHTPFYFIIYISHL